MDMPEGRLSIASGNAEPDRKRRVHDDDRGLALRTQAIMQARAIMPVTLADGNSLLSKFAR